MNLGVTLRLALLGGILGVGSLRAERIVLVAGGAEDQTGIPATRAALKEPFGVDFDAAGNLFIIEMAAGNRLLKVDAQGILTTSPDNRRPAMPATAVRHYPPDSRVRTISPSCRGTTS